MFDVRLLRYVRLNSNGMATMAGNFSDNTVGTFSAGSVIHDNRRAFGRQILGDGRADSFGRASNYRDFSCKLFRHDMSPV
jgi:hypothetical protein